MSLRASLKADLWGYRTFWDVDNLVLRIKKKPDVGFGLSGLRIAIDPGHGGDNLGSVGATRTAEKDINLLVSQSFAELLIKKGSEVLMTRSDDITLGLSSRASMVEEWEADVLISVHHNALPDGVNPFEVELGTGTYYYRPQSRDLAAAIQDALVAELSLPDEGIYYKDLAICRITNCPSILVECAYMMLPEQERIMLEEDYASRVANALYQGLYKFVRNRR